MSDVLSEYHDVLRRLGGAVDEFEAERRHGRQEAERQRSEARRRDTALRERLAHVQAEHAALVRRASDLGLEVRGGAAAGVSAGSDPLSLAEQVISRTGETLRLIAADDAAIDRAAQRLRDAEQRHAEQVAAERAAEGARHEQLARERAARRQRRSLLAIAVVATVLVVAGFAFGAAITVPFVLGVAAVVAVLVRSSLATHSGA